MIKDVGIKKLTLHCDDRGFFTEVLKFGEETYHPVKQTMYSETLPGIIKAFHWHKRKWDIWFIVKGMAQVVLYDLREDSPTKGETQVIYAGEKNFLLIAIPPYVAHGYRVLSQSPLGIFYHTTESYNPNDPDEERIPLDSPQIGFDWDIKNR